VARHDSGEEEEKEEKGKKKKMKKRRMKKGREKKELGGRWQWWECGVAQHHQCELLVHPNLPLSLPSSTSWEVRKV
jgi:hypothetical protein